MIGPIDIRRWQYIIRNPRAKSNRGHRWAICSNRWLRDSMNRYSNPRDAAPWEAGRLEMDPGDRELLREHESLRMPISRWFHELFIILTLSNNLKFNIVAMADWFASDVSRNYRRKYRISYFLSLSMHNIHITLKNNVQILFCKELLWRFFDIIN